MLINLFKSAYDNSHETIEIEKNTSIKEALPDLNYEYSIIAVNGYETDENYILKNNDICTIRQFPQGSKGGGYKWWEGVLDFFTLGGYSVTKGIVKGIIGIVDFFKSFNDLLNPSDTNNNNDTDLKNIPQLRGAKNQSNRGKPIPIVLGKHLYTPMFIGSPYTEIDGVDGEDQYYNALYLLGYGKLKVSEVRLGVISGLAENAPNAAAGYPHGVTDGMLKYIRTDGFCDPSFYLNNPLLELRQGANSDRTDGEVGLYPQRVVEERLNIELLNIQGDNKLEPIRFSAMNPQKVQVEITFNNGLISFNDDGSKKNAFVNIKLEWRDYPRNNPEEGWKEFGRFGTSIQGQSPTSYDSSTRITTITRQKSKVMRFIAERTFTWAEINLAINRTIEIRIIRMNPKPVNDTRTADSVFLTAIRTWCFDNETAVGPIGQKSPQAPMIQKFRDQTARLGFRIKATDNLQGTLDALNCIVESFARTWDGTKWSSSEAPTNNPASVALKVLQSPALGNSAYIGKNEEMLDLDSFGEFYEWCNETQRKYTCNGVLLSDKRVDDLLDNVLSTGRGMRILNGNRYAVLIDKPRENPVYILNSQNVLDAKNTKSFNDLPDAFSIKFINEKDGYLETEVYVTADGSLRPKPNARVEALEMPFITDHKQIIKNGRYLLACRHLRPEIWLRKLSVDGYLVGIGDRVEVQDDTIVVGIGEGAEIKGLKTENNVITEIQTDGEFNVVDTTLQYGIKIMQFDGYSPGKVRTIQVPITKPGIYYNFPVSIPLNTTPVPSVGDIISFGVYDRITTSALCFGKKNNGDGTFDVTLIPYQEGIYTTDSGKIPEYEANITSPQGIPPLNQIPPQSVTMPELIETVSNLELTGYPAVIHEVVPSVQMIIRNTNGTFEPNIISCSQVMIAGNEPPVPSNKLLQYTTSKSNGVYFLYVNPIEAGDWDWIEFLLSDNGVELDSQRVPVLREGSDAVFLDIENQNYPVFCTHEGVPKDDQIPFSVQCRLFRGIETANDVLWELANAPRGISINNNGLIAVNAEYKYTNEIVRFPAISGLTDPLSGIPFYPWNGKWITGRLELEAVTNIEVRAYYQSKIFTRNFRIRKVLDGSQGKKGDQGDDAPTYLGKVIIRPNLPPYNPVMIEGSSVLAKEGDYISYVGTTLNTIWTKGSCLQYTQAGWILLNPLDSRYTDFYMRAMRDIVADAPAGVFSVLMAQKIMAMQATIDELQTKVIILSKNNDGTGGVIKSNNYDESSGVNGWMVDFNGNAFFNDGTFAGNVAADSFQAGSLTLSKKPAEIKNFTFPEGTSAMRIVSQFGRNITLPTEGTYGSTRISKIRTVYNASVVNNKNKMTQTVYIIDTSNTVTMIAQFIGNPNGTVEIINTRYILTLQANTPPWTMTLDNLPTYPTNIPTEKGTVYMVPSSIPNTEGNYLLLIKG